MCYEMISEWAGSATVMEFSQSKERIFIEHLGFIPLHTAASSWKLLFNFLILKWKDLKPPKIGDIMYLRTYKLVSFEFMPVNQILE